MFLLIEYFQEHFVILFFLKIRRPMPRDGKNIKSVLKGNADEDILDAVSVREKIQNPDGLHTAR